MRAAHGRNRNFLLSRCNGVQLRLHVMEHTRLSNSVERVIHVPLSEAEWKAFLAAAPQPVNWLRERIQEVIEKNRAPKADA